MVVRFKKYFVFSPAKHNSNTRWFKYDRDKL
jgi:hypothetical protein